MTFVELIITAVGLSMDAFAVAVCTGLTMPRVTLRKASVVGLYFGVFQAVMPLVGYLLAFRFADQIESVDHWIAFVLLAIIGGNMVRESRSRDVACREQEEASLGPRRMLPLAVATSIDALAVGVSLAFLRVEIMPAVALIGVTTFLFSVAGTKVGQAFGSRFKSWAELAGGLILILMGTKILIEHLF